MNSIKPKSMLLLSILIATIISFSTGCDTEVTEPAIQPTILNELTLNVEIEEYEPLKYSMKFFVDMADPEVGVKVVRFCLNYDTNILTRQGPAEFEVNSLVDEFGEHDLIYGSDGLYYGNWTEAYFGYYGSGFYSSWIITPSTTEQTDAFSWKTYDEANPSSAYVKPEQMFPLDHEFTNATEVVKVTLQINGITTQQYWANPIRMMPLPSE